MINKLNVNDKSYSIDYKYTLALNREHSFKIFTHTGKSLKVFGIISNKIGKFIHNVFIKKEKICELLLTGLWI